MQPNQVPLLYQFDLCYYVVATMYAEVSDICLTLNIGINGITFFSSATTSVKCSLQSVVIVVLIEENPRLLLLNPIKTILVLNIFLTKKQY